MEISEELLVTLKELKRIFPDMRFGQLICNLTTLAQECDACDMWYVEDCELLEAAERLLEFNRHRSNVTSHRK